LNDFSKFYGGKSILITGGTGTIGVPLVKKLQELGAEVHVVSLDNPARAKYVFGTTEFYTQDDLRNPDACIQACKNIDYVFHLVAIKGCTSIGTSKVASAFVPFILCNTNMMEAAFRCGVSRYLYVSSICAYPPLPIRHEDDMWNGLPQANDRYTGIAKRTGEAQAETYLHEYGWDAVRIVRPSNVYGPFDDFDPKTAQVIPSLISKACSNMSSIDVWGDGSAVRDFIFSFDLVEGMLSALANAPACTPFKLGAGHGYSIKEVVEAVTSAVPYPPSVKWIVDAPIGDPKRILCMDRAKELLGFTANTSLKSGIAKTVEWYMANKELADKRGRELHG
jgi:GDP-L-fucose synthase